MELLEANNYKVCYHQRDFVLGETIDNNICNVIKKSKRTMCLVSKKFVQSAYCMREFDVALHRAIELGKKRLVSMLLESVAGLFDSSSDSIVSLEQ